jgi:hypothetical protein
MALRRSSGPAGSTVLAAACRSSGEGLEPASVCENAGGAAKAMTASGTKSVRIEFSWVAKQRAREFGESSADAGYQG